MNSNTCSLVKYFVWNHQYIILRNLQKQQLLGPQEFYYRFMYMHVAPSSDHSLLSANPKIV